MTDEEFKELIRILTQPHRVQNVFALFKHCEEAAELLQTQRSELEELRLKAPKTNNPKKMIEKLKTEISKKEKDNIFNAISEVEEKIAKLKLSIK